MTILKRPAQSWDSAACSWGAGLAVWMLCALALLTGGIGGAAEPNAAVTTLAEDIAHLDTLSRLTVELFYQRTATARRLFELTGAFGSDADRAEVRDPANRACEQLASVAHLQGLLKSRIEDDRHPDWEGLYGATGLWRRLHSDLYATSLDKAEIGLLAVLAADPNEAALLLRGLLGELATLSRTAPSARLKLAEARSLACLGRYEPSAWERARQVFGELAKDGDIAEPVALRCAVERIGLMGPDEPNEITALAARLAASESAGDLQLALSVVCAQLRYGPPEAFDETLAMFGDLARPVGALILVDLTNRLEAGRLDPATVPATQAELAAASALAAGAANHAAILRRLAAAENLQCPLVLYAAGVALSDSAGTEAVDLLMRAAAAQRQQPSPKLDVKPQSIAAAAARLAYNLFVGDRSHQELALRSLEDYLRIEPNEPDAQLQYLRATVLRHAGRTDEADRLLDNIATHGQGRWRHQAELDLIKKHIVSGQADGPLENSPGDRLAWLMEQISPKTADNPLFLDTAMTLCRLLLDGGDRAGAGRALDILNRFKDIQDPTLIVLKARALQSQGQIDTSLHYLFMACRADPQHLPTAMDALGNLIDDLDRLAGIHPRFGDVLRRAVELADYCYTSLDGENRRTAGLYLAELYIFTAETEPHHLPKARVVLEELPSREPAETHLLRCQARILTQEQNYPAAAALWARVAEAHRLNEAAVQRSGDFWRAKFFELHCLSQCPQPPRARIAHAIEVLEESFADIPLTWATRLAALKHRCRGQEPQRT